MTRSASRSAATAVAVVLLLAGCDDPPPPPVYQAVPAAARDIVVSASAAGAVEPITTVEVKSKASGEIIEVAVEVGDVVRPGQRLVRVDPRVPQNALTQAQADLEVAKAQLANAQSQLRRSEELYKTQSITEQEIETARLAAANANAQLVRARRSLDDATIAFEDTDVRAAVAGVVISRAVEVGTVISSATSNVGGGTVLLTMANLDTIQVRTLVDETDIGKIRPGMAVTIAVDAYPNRPFEGEVLKIEPQAVTQQNVTMFPVLIRIANTEGLLKPGMNAEVEIHVGRRDSVLAIPNAALRTQRDVGSAARVLGLDPDEVNRQLAQAVDTNGGSASLGGTTRRDSASGGERRLPEGVTREQMEAVFRKMRDGGGPSALSAEERALLQKVRSSFGGQNGNRGFGAGRSGAATGDGLFGGNYIVFVLRNGQPTPVNVRTGLTDLDYSEVRSGLADGDTVLILPSASLVAAQEESRERASRIGLPGVQQGSVPGGGGPPPGRR
ncbi:MAG TPA: efflux RND transporter periplasmic adaptor subunit [Gemmatimonadales bacterium]|nr:efflux RND transporter periplasmic adaptor subunit [Gemmatimonadales bacterium]